MKRVLTTMLLIAGLPLFVYGQTTGSCSRFEALIKATYNFKPSKLSEKERDAKAKAMDEVWNTAIANPKELLPCLRTSLENPNADPWFQFDGSNLLAKLDPSGESKTIQVRNYTKVDLDDVDLQIWVQTLAQRGAEGFDVSEASSRWLTYPRALYFLPQHGGHQVTTFAGALFLYGSMDESYATPALMKVVSQVNHPKREEALVLLMNQATPESLRVLKELDDSGFSEQVRAALRTLLTNPELITPREKPRTTRAEFLQAFQEIVDGKPPEKFFKLVYAVPDGEKDVVATLKPEDLPLVRKVRRIFISRGSPHTMEFYKSFTDILMTMISKRERPSAE